MMRVHTQGHKLQTPAARGFTLAELLVALTMSALLAMAAVAALRAGLLISSRIEADPPADADARRLLQAMSVELSGMYAPRSESGEPAIQQTETDRGEQTLSFFTTMPAWSRVAGVGRCVRVAYTFKPASGSEGGELLREEGLVAGETPITEPVSEPVLASLNSFAIKLFNQAGEPFEGSTDSSPLPRRASIAINAAGEESKSAAYTTEVYIPANTTLLAGKPAESQAAS